MELIAHRNDVKSFVHRNKVKRCDDVVRISEKPSTLFQDAGLVSLVSTGALRGASIVGTTSTA
jgi:hypothetical protein